tara:strand:- start:452 stop:1987 length:1536 start_codon:yes stop_codon:yes gene_type:complete
MLQNQELTKNKQKILFVAFYDYGSAGIRAIESFIHSNGYKTYTVFLKENKPNQLIEPTDKEKKLLFDKISEFNPDIIGMSLRSPYFETVSKITKWIRDKFPEKIVIWGGSHATMCPEECIKHVDYVVIGEGEYPLLKFIEKRTTDIKNFWIKKNNEIIKNALGPSISDLDTLPFPEFTNKCYIENDRLIDEDPIIKLNKYQIMASRGCPYQCTFCSNAYLRDIFKGKGSFVRRRSVDHVIKELIYVKKLFKNLSIISFLDEVFTSNKKWIEDFSKQYKEKINIPFRVLCYPTQVKEENIRILRGVGLRLVNMGLQCGSHRVRTEVYKRYTPDEVILKAAKIFKKYKLITTYDIIVDNPYETPEDMRESVNLLIKIPRPYNLRIYSLQNFPKTVLTKKMIDDGWIKEIGTGIQGFANGWQGRLNSERSKESLYYICLVSLLSKSFIPKALVKYFLNVNFFRNHIIAVIILTNLSSKLKMVTYGGSMILKGEVSFAAFINHLKNIKTIMLEQR